jgi:hypothetical protein
MDQNEPSIRDHHQEASMNAQQQREWEGDESTPSVFPEPLAARLTRENKELRAEIERWQKVAEIKHQTTVEANARADAAEAEIERLRSAGVEWMRRHQEAQNGHCHPEKVVA